MHHSHSPWAVRVGSRAAFASVLFAGLATAQAQTAEETAQPAGRIDFAAADLLPASIEVDLSQEIFSDLFGLGDAAIAGVVESLVEANQKQSSPATEMAAEQLAAVREILQLTKEVVREVHVRVYEDFPEEASHKLAARFQQQLTDGKWETVVKVREDNESVNVSLLRSEGAIVGIFVLVVVDGDEVVLANVVCDISPENVKQLSAAATKIGLEVGLREVIERIERDLKHLQ